MYVVPFSLGKCPNCW